MTGGLSFPSRLIYSSTIFSQKFFLHLEQYLHWLRKSYGNLISLRLPLQCDISHDKDNFAGKKNFIPWKTVILAISNRNCLVIMCLRHFQAVLSNFCDITSTQNKFF